MCVIFYACFYVKQNYSIIGKIQKKDLFFFVFDYLFFLFDIFNSLI